ncbi:hypothetical protein BPP43_06860 [Brachyspira pilosicoli P43/6/78]|uniref:Uncharacterized protein n=2 Tax=Brachyspira pilosicoli TaxID=52584 RepID=A0A3B6VL49_BRAPL|nr:hypothetical protein [Brachyspira pilosicoli]AGA66606.1 hypothetical protein BPP43_06860 [Brachyspira pilosicoli P43/6/78]
MKNKNLFFKIYIAFVVIFAVSIIVLSFLGNKERIGYLSEFKINITETLELNNLNIEEINQLFTVNNNLDEAAITNYVLTNNSIMNYSYNFRIKYYDKVFRNSDIYDVYPDINKISENNNYIKKIGMIRNGSPFGNLVSSRIIDDNEDSYDISYTLSLKIEYIIFLFFMIIFLIIFKYKSDSAFFDKNINIKLSTMMIMGYLYLILPYMIFVVTWTKYFVSIPITISMIILLYVLIKDSINNYNNILKINIYTLCAIIFISILFILITGVGEVFDQSYDALSGRNAVFRDLVNFSWPLIYSENGFGFVFYFAHWVIPALCGKLFGFSFAKVMLVLWSSFGILIFFILTMMHIKNKNNIFIIISLFIFIIFCPIDFHWFFSFKTAYNSNIQNIYWLFNQSIGIWVMSSLFLHQKKSTNFAFLGLSIVFYSPYAIIGILPYMIVKVILDVKNNKLSEIKNIFSVSNILSSISIFPLMYLYLSSTSTVNDGFTILIQQNILRLLISYMLNFGILMLLLFKDNKNNYIFYTTIFVFIFVSMIQYSLDHNFHRTNTTAFFFLYVFVIKYFNDNLNVQSFKKYVMMFIIIYSSTGVLSYIDFQLMSFINRGLKPTKNIGNTTYNVKENSWVLRTITCQDMDNSIFFKYIAKDKK